MKYISFKKFIPFIAFFAFGIPLLFMPFGSLDELWNYNFAINIARGRLPYVDFNMIQTPLSAYLAAIGILIFGNKLMVFRMIGIFLIAATYSLMYFICKRITDNVTIACVVSIFSYAFCYQIWTYNYNNLNLCIVLLIIFLELKENKSNYEKYIIPLLYGLTPLIKQNTGIVLLMTFWIQTIFSCFHKRISKKDSFIGILISICPGTLFFFLLLINGILPEFWEYAALGVTTFTHRIYIWQYMFLSPINFAVVIFILFTIVKSLILIIKDKCVVSREQHCRVLMSALSAGVVAYPLTDSYHIMVALIPYVICFLCCFRYGVYTKKQNIICIITAFAVLIISPLVVLINLDNDEYVISNLKHYEGIPISRNIENNIAAIDEYILNKEQEGINVIIANDAAAAYMIPIDRYTKNFDMLLVGNLGMKSVEGLLSEHPDAYFMVNHNDDTLGYQAHFELIRYIKDNFVKIGHVLNLDVYKAEN